MKQAKLIVFLCGVLLLTSFSCSKNDNCDESEWINISFETLGNDTIVYQLVNIDERKTNVFLVIRNQKDFAKYLRCNYEPAEIDFNSQILLAGRTKHHQCAILGEQRIVHKCHEVHYHIEVIEMLCHMPEDVFYFALIPAEYSKFRFRLNVIKN